MKAQCIFRCQIKGHTYRVVEIDDPNKATGKRYRAYRDRRRYDGVEWNFLGSAVGSVLTELSYEVLGEIKKIW